MSAAKSHLACSVCAYLLVASLLGCSKEVPIASSPSVEVFCQNEVVISGPNLQASIILRLRNRSKNSFTLQKEVLTTCGCTKAAIEKTTLAPGEATEVLFSMQYNGNELQKVDSAIIIMDPENNTEVERVEIPLQVRYASFFRSSPKHIRLSRIEDQSQELQSNTSIYVDSTIAPGSIRVISRPKFISEALIKQSQSGELKLDLRVPAAAITNSVSDELVLKAPDERVLRIPISVDFIPSVSISPRCIDLTKEPTRTFVVRTTQKSSLKSIKGPPEIAIRHEQIGVAGKMHLIKLERQGSAVNGKGSVLIEVKLESNEKELPYDIDLTW